MTETKMEYVRLGKSGLKVSKVILGCASYGSPDWQGWVVTEDEAVRHIKAAYDLGINAFDTSNTYSNGLSETILGKAIKTLNLPRDEIVVLTKVYFAVGRNASEDHVRSTSEEKDRARYVNQYGLSRKHIFEAVKHSLERLQLDYVDVLQCHRFDPDTPVEETMQALHDVVQAGYARYIGMSSCYAWQFAKMQYYARQRNLTEFISMQNLHNALYREEEREMAPMLQDMGVAMIPWSPLGRGLLARPIADKTTRTGTDFGVPLVGGAEDNPVLSSVNSRVFEIAQARGVSMAQVALAWSLSKPFVTAPIFGSTNIDRLRDTVAGVHLKLTEEEIKSIDEPYKPRSVVGHR